MLPSNSMKQWLDMQLSPRRATGIKRHMFNGQDSVSLQTMVAQMNGFTPSGWSLLVTDVGWHCSTQQLYPLPIGEWIIGRHPTMSAINLINSCASRLHCMLHVSHDGRVVLRDLESLNGTRVNGVPAYDRTPLEFGDVIQAGPTSMLLVRA